MSHQFDHEKLNVYHEALDFVGHATELLERVPKRVAVYDQLDRASTAIPLNIAEGTGKFTPPDRCRYYNTARGSALECAACLDVLVVKKILKQEITEAKAVLIKVVSMLVGLIKAVAPDRVYEEPGGYVARLPEEQVKVKEQDKRT
ncbi:MAG: four helix bundle protein [Verrucomicrobia bacterium]|nr:MAG: four helix bundle protein [Verrucomicrobiota bacterium]